MMMAMRAQEAPTALLQFSFFPMRESEELTRYPGEKSHSQQTFSSFGVAAPTAFVMSVPQMLEKETNHENEVACNVEALTNGKGVRIMIESMIKSLTDSPYKRYKVLTHLVSRSIVDPHQALKSPLQANTCAKKKDMAHMPVKPIIIPIKIVERPVRCTQKILK